MAMRSRGDRTPGTPVPLPNSMEPADFLSEVALLTRCITRHHHDAGEHIRRMRSKVDECAVEPATLVNGSYKSERKAALRFITDAFERQGFRDEWCVATMCLLDRVANASMPYAGRRSLEDMTAERLAAALIVLKQSPVEAEYGDEGPGVRELIYKASNLKKDDFRSLWPRIIEAELRMCRALDFRLAVPTVLDLAARLAVEVQVQTCGDEDHWQGLEEVRLPCPEYDKAHGTPAFAALTRYLVELALAHVQDFGMDPHTLYKNGVDDSIELRLQAENMELQKVLGAAAVLPLAALSLALEVFAAPAAVLKAFHVVQDELVQDLPESVLDTMQALKEALRGLRLRPPARCPVTSKWLARTCCAFPADFWPAGLVSDDVETPKKRRADDEVFSTEKFSNPHRLLEEESTQEPNSDSDIEFDDDEEDEDAQVSFWESQFHVTIERDAGSKWGMSLDSYAGKLIVSKLTAGVIPDWNQRNAAMKINALDEILSVNDITNDVKAMKDELKMATSLCMTIHRAGDGDQKARRLSQHKRFEEHQPRQLLPCLSQDDLHAEDNYNVERTPAPPPRRRASSISVPGIERLPRQEKSNSHEIGAIRELSTCADSSGEGPSCIADTTSTLEQENEDIESVPDSPLEPLDAMEGESLAEALGRLAEPLDAMEGSRELCLQGTKTAIDLHLSPAEEAIKETQAMAVCSSTRTIRGTTDLLLAAAPAELLFQQKQPSGLKRLRAETSEQILAKKMCLWDKSVVARNDLLLASAPVEAAMQAQQVEGPLRTCKHTGATSSTASCSAGSQGQQELPQLAASCGDARHGPTCSVLESGATFSAAGFSAERTNATEEGNAGAIQTHQDASMNPAAPLLKRYRSIKQDTTWPENRAKERCHLPMFDASDF